MSELTLHNVTYQYGDGSSALRSIELNLQSGERMALVGPNGAGKTSLLMAIAGLIKYSGDVLIDGVRLSDKSKHEIRKKMSFVFQNPDEMLFMPTVMEDVCFGLDSLGLSVEAANAAARAALSAVSLSDFEDRSAHHLSYGERRRVTLATVLARQSTLTLFDEPTRELDPFGRRQFVDLFQGMAGTLILATHDLELVLETCPRMILLDAGRIITQGDPRTILADASLMKAHRLEVPHSLSTHPHGHH
jgi:cobalt/nickel transport system ATP-binding protein